MAHSHEIRILRGEASIGFEIVPPLDTLGRSAIARNELTKDLAPKLVHTDESTYYGIDHFSPDDQLRSLIRVRNIAHALMLALEGAGIGAQIEEIQRSI